MMESKTLAPVGDKPWYTVQLLAAGSLYQLRVNDAIILDEQDGNPGSVELPLNPWIRNGSNSFEARLSPHPTVKHFDKETEITATIYRRDRDEDRKQRTEVGKLSCIFQKDSPEPKTEGNVRHEGEAIKITIDFAATVPFPVWQWFTSAPIEDDSATLRDLLAITARVHDLLATANVDAVSQMTRLRNAELALASFETLDRIAREATYAWKVLATGETTQLRPLGSRPHLLIHANHRFAELRSQYGSPLIRFAETDGSMTHYVPLIFCRSVAGDWVIIR
jgi:hypothetical protein